MEDGEGGNDSSSFGGVGNGGCSSPNSARPRKLGNLRAALEASNVIHVARSVDRRSCGWSDARGSGHAWRNSGGNGHGWSKYKWRDRGWKDFRCNVSHWSENEEIRQAASEVFGLEGPTEDVRLAIASWCPSLALGFSVHLSASARAARRAAMLLAKERRLPCQCEHITLAGYLNTACTKTRCVHCRRCLQCKRNLDPDVNCQCVPLAPDCMHIRDRCPRCGWCQCNGRLAHANCSRQWHGKLL